MVQRMFRVYEVTRLGNDITPNDVTMDLDAPVHTGVYNADMLTSSDLLCWAALKSLWVSSMNESSSNMARYSFDE